MTSIDIFWKGGTLFSTIQDVETITGALARFNSSRPPIDHKTVADIERYETIPNNQITQFGSMFLND